MLNYKNDAKTIVIEMANGYDKDKNVFLTKGTLYFYY